MKILVIERSIHVCMMRGRGYKKLSSESASDVHSIKELHKERHTLVLYQIRQGHAEWSYDFAGAPSLEEISPFSGLKEVTLLLFRSCRDSCVIPQESCLSGGNSNTSMSVKITDSATQEVGFEIKPCYLTLVGIKIRISSKLRKMNQISRNSRILAFSMSMSMNWSPSIT